MCNFESIGGKSGNLAWRKGEIYTKRFMTTALRTFYIEQLFVLVSTNILRLGYSKVLNELWTLWVVSVKSFQNTNELQILNLLKCDMLRSVLHLPRKMLKFQIRKVESARGWDFTAQAVCAAFAHLGGGQQGSNNTPRRRRFRKRRQGSKGDKTLPRTIARRSGLIAHTQPYRSLL